MQKILFNSKYGLTQAVLDGRKTMTRRAISPKVWEKYCEYERGLQSLIDSLADSTEYLISLSTYKLGEVVAIAQAYKDIPPYNEDEEYADFSDLAAGWSNKMFVSASRMPHHIKITDIKVERLQDISDDDCLREGIFQTRPTSPLFGWNPDTYYGSPREAFAALIDKVGKRGTWDSNPWCFVYEFELVD